MSSHENYHHKHSLELPSERNFGFVMTAAFAIFGCFPLLKQKPFNIYLVGIAGAFFLVTIIYPKILRPLNIAWTKLGLALGIVMTPVIMGIIYYGLITPFGVFFRMLGKDSLSLKFEPDLKSYWVERNPAGPKGESLRRQF